MDIPNIAAQGPGGDILASMNALNTFRNANEERKINAVKAQYAPLTTQAEAASKLAYSNLMGPQYTAKMLAQSGILANMTPAQQQNALKLALGPTQGQGTGANIFNQMQMPQPQESPGKQMINHLLSTLGVGGNEAKQNPMNGMPGNGAPNLQYMPDESQQFGGRNDTLPQNANPQDYTNQNSNPSLTAEDIQAMPAKQRQAILDSNMVSPQTKQAIKSFQQNAAEAAGVQKQEEQAGTYRAEAAKDLTQEYKQAVQLDAPYKKLASIIKTPEFAELQQLPGFRETQMNLLKNFTGTPEQKKMIGQFEAAAKNVVAATIKGFGGRLLASEIPLSESMKLGNNDHVNVMLGKLPVIMEFNELTKQRAKRAANIIEKEHVSELDALERADKELNGDKVREKIEKEFEVTEPQITEHDINATMQATGMTKEQVLNRLKQEGRNYGG